MGSSQSSQSGDTVNITIETEEGEADVKLTQDFITHVTGKDASMEEGSPSSDQEPGAPAPSPSVPSAQEILIPGYSGSTDNNSNKWKNLYEEERRKNEELNKLTEEEFDNAANQVKEELLQSKLGQLVPLCEENKQKVLQCYRDNPNRTLNCSSLVNQYVECVREARKSLLVQTLNKDQQPTREK